MLKRLVYIFVTMVVLVDCANRGRPVGGPVDEDPPVIVDSSPENFSTNFSSQEIKITFDEFIKVKDLQKQLIISPPLKYDPDIVPQGSASKYIKITIKDTLPPNTTYAFNFGNSIVDNNEENPFSYYRYVFSTGETIDSLSVQGIVLDAFEKEVDPFVSVMLYEKDSTYTDSIVYKARPTYITNTLDSLKVFSLENLRAGTYKLVAIKDNNSNYLFDPKSDKIGFVEGFIEVPKDTLYKIKLFKEELPLKMERPKQIGGTKILFPYQGELESLKIDILTDSLPDDFEYRLIKEPGTDSINYWYKPNIKRDSAFFKVSTKTYVDTLKHRFRVIDLDTMNVQAYKSGVIGFDEMFTIENTTPFKSIDTSLVKMITRDSMPVSFGVKLDTLMNRYEFPVKLQRSQGYNVQMLPGAIEDFYGNRTKDTLRFSFGTKAENDYGKMRVTLNNGQLPMIVQLVNERGDVKYEKIMRTSSTTDFENLNPGQYYIRVIFDANYNGKWDTGNFLQGRKPERASYLIDVEPIRANFDFVNEFNLLNETSLDLPKN